MNFNYQTCRDWILGRIEQLKTNSEVAIKESVTPMRSVLVTISSKSVEAELVIWENGSTSMLVFSITGNKYIIDRHDCILNDGNFSTELSKFVDNAA